MSVSVAVNETVNFTCTAIADIIHWEVNGLLILSVNDENVRKQGFDVRSPLIVLNATQNLRTRTLSAFGSVDNNGSSITCVAIAFSITPLSFGTSEPVVLLVFESGIL